MGASSKRPAQSPCGRPTRQPGPNRPPPPRDVGPWERRVGTKPSVSREASLACPILPRPVLRVLGSPRSLSSLTQHHSPSQVEAEQALGRGEGLGEGNGPRMVWERGWWGAASWQGPGTEGAGLSLLSTSSKRGLEADVTPF